MEAVCIGLMVAFCIGGACCIIIAGCLCGEAIDGWCWFLSAGLCLGMLALAPLIIMVTCPEEKKETDVREIHETIEESVPAS